MSNDPGQFDPVADALESLGRKQVPAPNADFVDDLEAELRARHHGDRGRRVPGRISSRALIGAAATVVVLAALVGLSRFGSDDRSPLEVSTAATTEAAQMLAERGGAGGDEPLDGDSGSTGRREPAGSQDATPTATAVAGVGLQTPSRGQAPTSGTVPIPTAVAEQSVAPTTTADPTSSPAPGSGESPVPSVTPTSSPAPTSSPLSSATPVPESSPAPGSGESPVPSVAPTVTPVPTSSPVARPTPVPSPVPTLTPVARPTPVPSVVPTVTPLPSPAPTSSPSPVPTSSPVADPTPEALEIAMTCEVQRFENRAGVQCSWREALQPIDAWVLHRIRNGADRELIERLRPGVTRAVDTAVRPGDEIVYVLQGLRGDQVLVESILVAVSVP